MSPRRHPQLPRGFTLIELIVALFITAIIFAVGYGGINQALRHHEELKQHQDRLREVQNAVRAMVQDFAELAPRPIRDPLGQNWLPCITAVSTNAPSSAPDSSSAPSSAASEPAADSEEEEEDSAPSSGPIDDSDTIQNDGGPDLVAFTRAGWANPAAIQRSTLERVSYRFANGILIRMHWTVLDGTESSFPVRRDLLTHVKSVTFRYMNDARQWVDQWPATGSSTLRTRPFAVQITLELEDWGEIVRIIEVPA